MKRSEHIVECTKRHNSFISQLAKNNGELIRHYINKFYEANKDVLNRITYISRFDKDNPVFSRISDDIIGFWISSKLSEMINYGDGCMTCTGMDYYILYHSESELDISSIKELAEKISANILKSQN